MDYRFGTVEKNGRVMESLRTKEPSHTNLDGQPGIQQIQQDYPDSIITDSFIVSEKYRSAEDSEGNCYDWYIITSHNRYIDKYTPNADAIKEEFLTIQEQMIDNAALDVGADFNITEEV